MPSLTQLEYALAVEKHKHFGRAADACHISQPTLSQQLSKLEDELGVMLFDRLQKPVLATEEGKIFLDQARIVVREHQKLLHLTQQSKTGEPAGEFRLAVIPTIASHLIPLFLQTFAKNYPKVDLSIEEMKTENILEELREDRLDGGVLATPIEGINYKVHPLYYEPFFLYLSLGHPLLQKKYIEQKDLSVNEMWLLQDGHCFKDQVLSFCTLPKDPEAFLSNIRFQSGSLDTLKRLIQRNRGYTLIPALMLESMGKREIEQHVRPFRDPVPTREVSFLYRRDHWKLNIIKTIEEAILQSVPDSVSREKKKGQSILELKS